MIAALNSIRLGYKTRSVTGGSMGDLKLISSPKKAIFFTPTSGTKIVKGPKWCRKHNLVCMNTIPAPSFQNSMACEDYVVIHSRTDRYRDLCLDPLPEVPSYVAAPPPLKSLPFSKSMSDILTNDSKLYKISPLTEMSFSPSSVALKDNTKEETDSDDSEEIDPRIYNNPPPPLKLLKNLPVMRVY